MLSFYEHEYLTEFTHSPQEFHLTADTKIPERLYATFTLGENRTYIMSLIQSSVKGVYILEAGRTKERGTKTYWWRFHSQKDLIPVISTVLEFAQSAIPFMQGKIKGIALQIRNTNAKKIIIAEKIAKRILKKSYIQTFNQIPVNQPSADVNGSRFIFFAKKGINPKTLFKPNKSSFSNYEFEDEYDITLTDLTYMKPKKPTTTTEKSKRYFMGKYEIVTSIADEDLMSRVETVVPTESTVEGTSEIKDDFFGARLYNVSALTTGAIHFLSIYGAK